MLYYGGHLLLFCSDPAEAQKVINKVATEKGVLYINPLKARKRGVKSTYLRGVNVLHYGPWGGGAHSRKGLYTRKLIIL